MRNIPLIFRDGHVGKSSEIIVDVQETVLGLKRKSNTDKKKSKTGKLYREKSRLLSKNINEQRSE